jgi:nucleoid DNA-binding protein
MLKRDLIEAVQSRTGQPKNISGDTVEAVFAVIADCLSLGEKVDIRGFGVFVLRKTPERRNFHPGKGEVTIVPAKTKIIFRAGERVVRVVNGEPA